MELPSELTDQIKDSGIDPTLIGIRIYGEILEHLESRFLK